MIEHDILIIGSGIAGLSFAIKIAEKRPDLKLGIITKKELMNSNTKFAQGGIAVVLDKLNDSFEAHINDTIEAGGGLSKKDIVEHVVRSAPERLNELQRFGVEFSRRLNGKLELGLEGGHSAKRIVHVKDKTGLAIEQNLVDTIKAYKNISLFTYHYAIDFLTHDSIDGTKKVIGSSVFNTLTNQKILFRAKITVLATGGCGQIFKYTTNPKIATGDGVAMASRVGAAISNMKYIQFHPTAMYQKRKFPLFLISEAVRGFGAHIRNSQGNRFLFDTSKRGELETRDIVSKAIMHEMQRSGVSHVYLDCSHLRYDRMREKFPSISKYCEENGYNLANDLIPIVPAAHYQCGGITVTKSGRTTIGNLYAIGECSDTGLHGKNRLASNSLLEALVYAHDAAEDVLKEIDSIKMEKEKLFFEDNQNFQLKNNQHKTIVNKIQRTMSKLYSIDPSKDQIIEAHNRLKALNLVITNSLKKSACSIDTISMLNIYQVANIIIDQNMIDQ